MAHRAELLSAYIETAATLKASEAWEQSYKDSPKTFKALVRAEAELQAAAAEYLYGLGERIDRIVDWSQVDFKPALQADAVPPRSSDDWKAEERLLYGATDELILTITLLGAQAGEVLYESPVGVSRLSTFIIDAAATQTAGLVSQVTDTTRDLLRRSIQQAVAEGRDYAGTLELVKERISNPVRAEMIASTESVNAYQSGLYEFARETGAKSKTWEALIGACKLCSPLNGKTIKLDKKFMLPNGREVSKPAAHPRCRCGIIYNYPEND